MTKRLPGGIALSCAILLAIPAIFAVSHPAVAATKQRAKGVAARPSYLKASIYSSELPVTAVSVDKITMQVGKWVGESGFQMVSGQAYHITIKASHGVTLSVLVPADALDRIVPKKYSGSVGGFVTTACGFSSDKPLGYETSDRKPTEMVCQADVKYTQENTQISSGLQDQEGVFKFGKDSARGDLLIDIENFGPDPDAGVVQPIFLKGQIWLKKRH